MAIYRTGNLRERTILEVNGSQVHSISKNLAVADFFHAPDISEVNLAKYTGKIGDTIAVTVTDDFSVQEVSVTIQNGDGTLVEQGLAQKAPGGVQWIYTAIADNSSLEGDKIIIKASDLPGHATEQEEAL